MAKIYRREAAIWNMVACLAKGRPAHNHAPSGLAGQYMVKAMRRLGRLRDFVEKHPVEAARECEGLIAEYKARAAARALAETK